jgi:hypothetical protein
MAHPLDGEARPSEGPQEIAESRLAESWPAAVECGGDMAFVYRDRRGGDSRDQLFLGRLSASGEVLRRPQRVARFDGRSRASLLTNGHVVASVALRSWSKEWILGFDRFDCAGQRQGAELHVFANQVRFTDVDALRVGTRYLLLYAEDEPEQRVWLAAIHCR